MVCDMIWIRVRSYEAKEIEYDKNITPQYSLLVSIILEEGKLLHGYHPWFSKEKVCELYTIIGDDFGKLGSYFPLWYNSWLDRID